MTFVGTFFTVLLQYVLSEHLVLDLIEQLYFSTLTTPGPKPCFWHCFHSTYGVSNYRFMMYSICMYCMCSVGSISHTSLSLKIITFTRYPFYWKRNLNTCLPTDDSQWRMRAIAVIRGWQNIPAIAVFSQPLTLLQNILSFCNDLFLIVKLPYTLLNVLVVTSHLMKF